MRERDRDRDRDRERVRGRGREREREREIYAMSERVGEREWGGETVRDTQR